MGSNSFRILHVFARQIFNSKGHPTVEAEVVLGDGSFGRASVPSGTSTGRYEARELRDGDKAVFSGRGVMKPVANIRGEIASAVIGLDALDQLAIDTCLRALDGTLSLERLGANAILAVSLATARAAANHLRLPLYRYLSHMNPASRMSLPMPMINILGGGVHAGNGVDFQDIMMLPIGATTYSAAVAMGIRVREIMPAMLANMKATVHLADDGSLHPNFQEPEQVFEAMVRSFEAVGLRPGSDAVIAVDVAASELMVDGKYHLSGRGANLTGEEMVGYIRDLLRRFPIMSVEDPLDQDDWTSWRELTRAVSPVQVVGDDLFATNIERVNDGIEAELANSCIIKLNQNGTLSGALAVIAALRRAGLRTVVAARSGDTEDTFISDLAVGCGADQIKIGTFRNSERIGKYNHLLRIEDSEDLHMLPFCSMSMRN